MDALTSHFGPKDLVIFHLHKNTRLLALVAISALGTGGCLSARTRQLIESGKLAADRPALENNHPAPATGPRPSDDHVLAGDVELATLEGLLLARHPALSEATERIRAAGEKARAEGSLPPTELGSELWQVPLARPYRIDQAGMIMNSVRQTITPFGARDGMAEAAAHEALMAAAMRDVKARELLHELGRAFADYAETNERKRIHKDHLDLLAKMREAAVARYSTGGALTDVTKAELEQAMMRAHLAKEHAGLRSLRARINGLCAREPDAPLGSPRLADPASVHLPAKDVALRASRNNPDVLVADEAARAAAGMRRAADAESAVPSFTIGANLFLPVAGNDFTPGWGASFGMTMPWLTRGAAHRRREREHTERAEKFAADGVRLRVATDAGAALEEVRAAEDHLVLLRDGALPAARRSLEATAAAYVGGGSDILAWLDAARAQLDIQLEMTSARADLDRALADLDFAAGERLPRSPLVDHVEDDHDH